MTGSAADDDAAAADDDAADEAAEQRERDDQVRRDLARARAAGVGPTIAFVRELGFEELLED